MSTPHKWLAALALSLWGASAFAPQASPAERDEVRVFAAASLADVLAEIGTAWQASSGNRLVFNFGASSDLARQITAGAPADVFFSADTAQMQRLVNQGLVTPEALADLLSNTLAVVVPKGSAARITSARDLAGFATIAVADPEAVPAGVYARDWLEAQGAWSALREHIVPMLHVRAALAAVESGNAGAAIVYKTDAARSARARIAFEVPRAHGPKIVYPVAPLAAAPPAAAAFASYLKSPAARAAFLRHGFLVLGGQ